MMQHNWRQCMPPSLQPQCAMLRWLGLCITRDLSLLSFVTRSIMATLRRRMCRMVMLLSRNGLQCQQVNCMISWSFSLVSFWQIICCRRSTFGGISSSPFLRRSASCRYAAKCKAARHSKYAACFGVLTGYWKDFSRRSACCALAVPAAGWSWKEFLRDIHFENYARTKWNRLLTLLLGLLTSTMGYPCAHAFRHRHVVVPLSVNDFDQNGWLVHPTTMDVEVETT